MSRAVLGIDMPLYHPDSRCVHPACCVCRYYVREIQETEASQIELFLNSVPILASLSRDEKLRLVDALEQQTFKPTARVINQVPRPFAAPPCLVLILQITLHMPQLQSLRNAEAMASSVWRQPCACRNLPT